MEVLYPRCCGWDVPKSSMTACALLREQGRIHGAAPIYHHDSGIEEFGCLASATSGDSCSYGIDRSLLEASMERTGGTLHYRPGQRPVM